MYLHSRTQAASGYCVELDACNKTKVVSLSRRVDPVRPLVCLPKWMQARHTVANGPLRLCHRKAVVLRLGSYTHYSHGSGILDLKAFPLLSRSWPK